MGKRKVTIRNASGTELGSKTFNDVVDSIERESKTAVKTERRKFRANQIGAVLTFIISTALQIILLCNGGNKWLILASMMITIASAGTMFNGKLKKLCIAALAIWCCVTTLLLTAVLMRTHCVETAVEWVQGIGN